VGITCTYQPEGQINSATSGYVRAVERAGGLPLLIPLLQEACQEELFTCLDGIILGGGGDIGSFYFDEEPHPGQGRVFPPLDEQEMSLGQRALEMEVPLLGICRGMQVLNVAMGGTLYQDLPGQYPGCLQHFQNMPRNYPVHTVYFKEDSMLSSVTYQKKLQVNSFHHQAVKEVAPRAVATAVSSDEVVEAIEVKDHVFAMGVQWHPEAMEDSASELIFRKLLRSCRKGKYKTAGEEG